MLPLTILALLWLPILVLPLVARLPAGVSDTFNVIDYLVWAAFVVEYLVRLYLTPSRRRFFTSHLVDLAVVALPALRPLRALRLLRLLNLARAGAVLANALKRAREILTHRGLRGRATPTTRSGHADHPPAFRKLDAVAVLTARLLPAPLEIPEFRLTEGSST